LATAELACVSDIDALFALDAVGHIVMELAFVDSWWT
jgi:hypothetical protein